MYHQKLSLILPWRAHVGMRPLRQATRLLVPFSIPSTASFCYLNHLPSIWYLDLGRHDGGAPS
jgi:hypothetical protein